MEKSRDIENSEWILNCHHTTLPNCIWLHSKLETVHTYILIYTPVKINKQLIVSLPIPALAVAPHKVEFSKQSCIHKICWGLFHCGRINRTCNQLRIKMWKLVVKAAMRHSVKVLYSNNLILVITRWETNIAYLNSLTAVCQHANNNIVHTLNIN
jgi:hypothetical protein